MTDVATFNLYANLQQQHRVWILERVRCMHTLPQPLQDREVVPNRTSAQLYAKA